jgi:hypothetical protein
MKPRSCKCSEQDNGSAPGAGSLASRNSLSFWYAGAERMKTAARFHQTKTN